MVGVKHRLMVSECVYAFECVRLRVCISTNSWVRVQGKATGMCPVTVRISVRVEVGVCGINGSVNANVRATC